MTRTDQAFIEAFERVEHPTGDAPAAPNPSPSAGRRHRVVHGPHMEPGEKASLADVIAQRMRHAATGAIETPDAAIVMRSFAWPQTVERLAAANADEYDSLAPQQSTGPLALGLAGVQRGSGATTTTLALARCLAAKHGPIAIIDADPTRGMANSLGLLETPTLADAVAGEARLRETLIHARDDNASLLVAGALAETSAQAIASTLAPLRRSHPVVLIDLGSALDYQEEFAALNAPLLAAAGLAGVALVRCADDLLGAAPAAQQVVESAGATVLGLIENRVPTSAPT